MSPLQISSLLALTIFAIYRQTRTSEVAAAGRFNTALAYAGIASLSLLVSGWTAPKGAGWFFFLASLVSSGIIGIVRGRMTRVWLAEDGRCMRAGTALTVGLFVAMLATKIGFGAYARLHGIDDGAGFGEILIVVAIMVAVQAEIVFRRATALKHRYGHEGGVRQPPSFPKATPFRTDTRADDR